MKKNGGRLLVVLVLSFIFFLSGLPLCPESGIFDRLGTWPESGYHGAFPEENPDLFSGGLCLKFLDIRLSGPNGFDLKLWRVYNSKVLRDRLSGSIWGIQAEPYSYCGMSVGMHMGRIHNFNSTEPIIEFPDGKWETAYPAANSSDYITRGFLKYDKANYKLYFLNGTAWTFGLVKTITYVGSSEEVRVVTKIENSYGHTINITYQSGSNPALSSITDSMGRTINFVLSNNRLDYISVKNANGGTVLYDYTVGTFPGGYYQLQEYAPPEIPASTYEYNNGQYDHYELTAVNTSFGARIEYDYRDHTFYFKTQPLETRVLKEKRIKFNAGEPFKE
jgi:hypothetical protein